MLVAGLLFGGAGTSVAHAADVNMAYSCRFPSGAQQVAVRVRASLPAQGTVGQDVSPGKPTVTLTVPRAALGDLTKLDAATVGASEKLTVNVAQSGGSAATVWQDLGAAQTALPPDGDLVLKATGVAQAVRPTASGKVVFAAGPLAVDLTPRKADGTATSPPLISLSCAPAGGSDTSIGAVAISDGTVNPPGTGQPSATQQAPVQTNASEDFCPPPPTPQFNPKKELAEPPRLTNTDPPLEADPENFGLLIDSGLSQPGCVFAEGLSNVKKLAGATSFGRTAALDGFILLEQDFRPEVNFVRLGAVTFTHFEPRPATLLSFGFVPVTATVEVTSVGNTNIFLTSSQNGGGVFFPTTAIAKGEFQLRLTDARVNGVPLNLGPHCRSAHSLVLTLTGGSIFDPSYSPTGGGRLTGEITIPPWIGCGVGEDLDPLLTASVSGPGNFASVIQGPICNGPTGSTPGAPCPPAPFGFTVDPGGRWTATSDHSFNLSSTNIDPALGLSCESAMMKGSLRSGPSSNPRPIGEVTDFSPASCSATPSSPAPLNFTITPVGLPWKLHVDELNPGTDAQPQSIVRGHFEGAKLHFAATNENCSFDVSDKEAVPGVTPSSADGGPLNFWYDNSTHAFSFSEGLGGFASKLAVSHQTIQGCQNVSFAEDADVRFADGPVLHMPTDPPQTIDQPRSRCETEVQCPHLDIPR